MKYSNLLENNFFFLVQRLEFLGDAVLDYVITVYLYNKYPGMSPELLTDMRSASVNNDCYALSAVKAGLHKHILHTSHQLHKEIVATVSNFDKLSLESTFGWETESSFPKVGCCYFATYSVPSCILIDHNFCIRHDGISS